MPRYITVAPTFNPLSIDDYLKVPLAIDERYREQESKLDSYKDNISLIRNWLGDDAKELFRDYDSMMDSLASDPSYRNMIDVGNRLKDSYRDIASRYVLAKENRDKYQSMLDKDPSLIGTLGTPYEWYLNPDRDPGFISGKDLAATIGGLTATEAQSTAPRKAGYFGDPRNKQVIYESGLNPNDLSISLANALAGTPSNAYESSIRGYLDSIGYDTLPAPVQQRVRTEIGNAMLANSGYGTKVNNELAYDNIRSQMANRGKSRTTKSSGSGSGTKKPKLAYDGVVSTRNPRRTFTPTGKASRYETRTEVTNRIDAEIPDGAQLITVEEARTQYPNLFNKLFSNSKIRGMELASNADKYDFYIAYDDDLLGVRMPQLYIEPKEDEEDLEIASEAPNMENVDVSNMF